MMKIIYYHTTSYIFFFVLSLFSTQATASYFPIYHTWPITGDSDKPLTLTYSYSNVLNGNLLDSSSNEPILKTELRAAFEAAFWDYANILPITFVEVADNGPLPESGEYDPIGKANIRIGQVFHVEDANAYAYFPFSQSSGLAGDIVFNANRFGNNWTLGIFYGVAQHELGHSLGMGHALSGDPPDNQPEAFSLSSGYTGPRYPLSAGMISALQNAYGVGSGSVIPLPIPSTLLLMLSGISFFRMFGINLSKVNL